MYHDTSDHPWGIKNLFVKPDEFEEQLKYLKQNSFQAITFEDFNQIGNYKNPIFLTFDDGYSGNYDVVFPLLKKY